VLTTQRPGTEVMKGGELTSVQIAALAVPTIAFAGFELAQKVLLPVYLTDHVGVGLGLAGFLLVGFRLFDIVLDTAVGAVSDVRLSQRIGRRRIWMAAGIVPALAGCVLVFTAQPGTGLASLIASLALMTLGWSMINAAHGAWALEAGKGILARSRVFGARTAAGVLGYLAFSGLAAIFAQHLSDQMRAMTIALLIGVPVSTAVAFAFVRDDVDMPGEPFSLRTLAASAGLGVTSGRRARLALLFALVGASQAIAAGSFMFLFRRGLELPDLAGNALLVQAIATVGGLPIGLWMMRRLGAKRLLMVVFAAEAVVSLGLLTLPVGEAAPALVWVVARGFLSGIDFMLIRALAGEELDAESRITGRARAGAFYAAFHLPFNLMGALATGLLFGLYRLAGSSLEVAAAPSGQPAFVAIPALAGCSLALMSLVAVLGIRSLEAHNPPLGRQTF
jgi:Na+/melibiose symporter-like transporter